MRDPALLIGARALTLAAAETCAAVAGCEASTKQSTTAAVMAHLITRIYVPFPQSRLTISYQ